MSASHGVEELIKWIKRDEWRNDFEAVFDRHLRAACRCAASNTRRSRISSAIKG